METVDLLISSTIVTILWQVSGWNCTAESLELKSTQKVSFDSSKLSWMMLMFTHTLFSPGYNITVCSVWLKSLSSEDKGERERKRKSKNALSLVHLLLELRGEFLCIVSTLGLNVIERGNNIIVVPVSLAQTLAWPCVSGTITFCDIIVSPVDKKTKELKSRH